MRYLRSLPHWCQKNLSLLFYLISLVNLVQSVVTSQIKVDVLFNTGLSSHDFSCAFSGLSGGFMFSRACHTYFPANVYLFYRAFCQLHVLSICILIGLSQSLNSNVIIFIGF